MADQDLNIVVDVQGAEAGASEIKGLSSAVKGVGTTTEQTAKKTSGLRSTLSGLATGFAVYKGAQFIKGAVNETTALAKATVGLQRITGMDATTAGAWVAIAKERGVQAKQLNMGFISLAKNITAATGGSKSAQTAFAALGLNAANLKVQDSRTQMSMLADSFKALPPGVDKAALAQKIFGRQAQALLPLLNQGSVALNGQVTAMAKHTGMSGQTIKDSLELAKTQREWSATMLGVKVAVATALLPVLTQLAKLIEPIAQAFAEGMRSSSAFRIAILALTPALITFIAVMKIVNFLGKDFTLSWGLIPALIVGVAIALVLMYQKVGWFRNAVNAMGQAALAAFGWVKQAAMDAYNWIKNNWPLLVSIIGGPIGAVAVQVVTHWHDIKQAGTDAFNAVKSVAQGAAQVVGGAFKAAWDAVYGAIRGVVIVINQVVGAANKVASLPSKVLDLIGGGVSSVAGGLGSMFGQHGLYASHAGTAVVGEHGPEIMHVPQGTRVTPHVPSFGGGGKVQVHTHVYIGSREVALAVGDYVASQQAAR